ncbi:MAG: Trm112 family protein [Patescibacteria group bacterium]
MKDIKKEKFSQYLLRILACPEDKAGLDYNLEKNILICKKCRKEYKIKNNIPIFYEND